MGDQSVDDLWAGLDSFESELSSLAQGQNGPNTAVEIEDVLEMVEKQQRQFDALSQQAQSLSSSYSSPTSSFNQNGSRNTSSSVDPPRKPSESAKKSSFSSPSPSIVTIETKASGQNVLTHESKLELVKSLLIEVRGTAITDIQRSAIERLLALVPQDSQHLDPLLAVQRQMQQRKEMNRGAPTLLIEHQAKLDAEIVLDLEKKLAQAVVSAASPSPKQSSIPSPSQNTLSSISHSSRNNTPSRRPEEQIKQILEISESIPAPSPSSSNRNPNNSDSNQSSIYQTNKNTSSNQQQSQNQFMKRTGSSNSPTQPISSNLPIENSELQKKQLLEEKKRQLEEQQRKEQEEKDRIEEAKNLALAKARQEYEQKLEEQRIAQEEQISRLKKQQEEERANHAQKLLAEQRSSEAKLAAIQQKNAESEAKLYEEIRKQALEIARKELEAENAEKMARQEEKYRQEFTLRENLEATLAQERDAQRRSQATVEEAFRAKLLAETRVAQEEAARRKLEFQLENEAREREMLLSKLHAGEQSQALLKARIDNEVQTLHSEYLAKIENAKLMSAAAAAAAEATEKARLRDQLLQLKAESERRSRENEELVQESKRQLLMLQTKQEATERQLNETKQKYDSMESVKQKAVQHFASIEAEHLQISENLNSHLAEAERSAQEERVKMAKLLETQKGAAKASLAMGVSSDASQQQEQIRKLADAAKSSQMEIQLRETEAMIAAQRQAFNEEQEKAAASRERLEKASVQMISRIQIEQPSSPSQPSYSPTLSTSLPKINLSNTISPSSSPLPQTAQQIVSTKTVDQVPPSVSLSTRTTEDQSQNNLTPPIVQGRARRESALHGAADPILKRPTILSKATGPAAAKVNSVTTTSNSHNSSSLSATTHKFNTAKKESCTPSDDLLSFYQPVPASSSMPTNIAPKQWNLNPSTAGISGSGNGNTIRRQQQQANQQPLLSDNTNSNLSNNFTNTVSQAKRAAPQDPAQLSPAGTPSSSQSTDSSNKNTSNNNLTNNATGTGNVDELIMAANKVASTPRIRVSHTMASVDALLSNSSSSNSNQSNAYSSTSPNAVGSSPPSGANQYGPPPISCTPGSISNLPSPVQPHTGLVCLHVIVPSLRDRVFVCAVDPLQSIAALKLFMWVEVFAVQGVELKGSHVEYVFRAEEDDYFSDEKMILAATPYYIDRTKENDQLMVPNSSSLSSINDSSRSRGKSASMTAHLVAAARDSAAASLRKLKYANRPIQLYLVSKQEISKVNDQIESMIGYKLSNTEEAKAFRQEMHSVVSRVMSISYNRVKIPQLDPFDNVDDYLPSQFNIHVWFWNENSQDGHQNSTVSSRLHDSAITILQRIQNDHPYRFMDYSENPQDYVLKVRGIDEWVWEKIEIISLATIRTCLRKRRLVELVVYPKDSLPKHVSLAIQRYESEQAKSSPALSAPSSTPWTQSPSLGRKNIALNNQRNAIDTVRSSVAMGFDLSSVFKTEESFPDNWFRSWDLNDKPLTVKIRSLDHIAFDNNLFKLPKKRDALTHIFVAASVVTPAGVFAGSSVPYTTVGAAARTLPELYLEESLEPITWRADLFLPMYSMIPRASKIRLEVVVRYKDVETTVAWLEQPIFGSNSIVKTGVFSVNCALGNSSTCGYSWSASSNGLNNFISNLKSIVGGSSNPNQNASNQNDSLGGNSSNSSNNSGSIGNNPSGSTNNQSSNQANSSGNNTSNPNFENVLGPQLVFEVEALEFPVVFPTRYHTYSNHQSLGNLEAEEMNPTQANAEEMTKAMKALLYRPTKKEQFLFWKHRTWCSSRHSKSLDLMLTSVPWSKPGALQYSYLMLDKFQPAQQPLEVIQILNKNHLEPRFREYAVRTLHRLSDSELAEVLLQLVQALKHEINHDSALARFLIVRALFNQNQIGHYFYWHLKACLQNPTYRDRFSLVLEVYLRYCSSFRSELYTQTIIYNRLIQIASELKTIKDPTKRIPFLHEKLQHMSSYGIPQPNPAGFGKDIQHPMPSTFQLPINCNMIASQFNVSKCKNLESKTLPLWLVCKSADPLGEALYGIMKVGDDLRQDQLTLQMFGIMDKLWLANGLDLKMSAYRVIETGSECGMIEVVPNAQTNASIQKQYGGVTAAFSEKPLSEWLAKNNPNSHDLSASVKDFAASCAGYCVATYVLGIGDRHNDNIMITKGGHLFHIDFGRFLGNSEKFAGVSRDRAPFVFTPEFAFVMGGPGSPVYQKFVTLACQAYNIVRHHASLFTSLLTMMLQTGIPELRSEDDIRYLADAFSLELTDEEAAQKFESLISKSLLSTSVQLNFAIHIWANPEK